MTEPQQPLTPPDCDLRDFQFIPIDIVRLFNSEFHARVNDSEWRAGVTLWLKSFHQVPAGSIPDDDVSLARLAELGRDVKSWKKIKESALYGWIKCSDGRFYHPVVAEKALEAWQGKRNQRTRTGKARLQAMLAKLLKSTDMFEFAHLEGNIQTLLDELSQSLSQTEFNSLKRSVTDSVTEAKGKREGKGQGDGKGKGQGLSNSVPTGTGADAPTLTDAEKQQAVEAMTKAELWNAGKSLLRQAGMPEAQCGTFVGKLVKDYGDKVVIEAVRCAVFEQPADPASFLKAVCERTSGKRKTGADDLAARQQASNDEARRMLEGGNGKSEVIDV